MHLEVQVYVTLSAKISLFTPGITLIFAERVTYKEDGYKLIGCPIRLFGGGQLNYGHSMKSREEVTKLSLG